MVSKVLVCLGIVVVLLAHCLSLNLSQPGSVAIRLFLLVCDTFVHSFASTLRIASEYLLSSYTFAELACHHCRVHGVVLQSTRTNFC
jgi:hypothetical protein